MKNDDYIRWTDIQNYWLCKQSDFTKNNNPENH